MKLKLKALAVPVLILVLPALRAASFYNSPVYVTETAETVLFYGTVDMASDGTGSFYTQAFQIDDCNEAYAFLGAYTNDETGDDVNACVQYNCRNAVAADTASWKSGLAQSGQILDDLNGGVVQADTVNVTDKAEDRLYNASFWCRFCFIGQSGNPAATKVTWFAVFRKVKPNDRPRNRSRVKSTLNVN